MSETRVAGVRITSPDRLITEGVTKRDLAEHYARVASRMLDHAGARPLTLVRCPKGLDQGCFFQKHAQGSFPDSIGTVMVRERKGEAPYATVKNAKGLIALAQISAMEVHVHGARNDHLDRPDRVVFDLDPGPGLSFADVRAAAREVRAVLKARDLESFPLVTGGKGIHVVVPIVRRNSWEDVRELARDVAREMSTASPTRYVAVASKTQRRGRIFIDWLRNGHGATAICPWSPRAKKGLPVAVPLQWSELGRVRSADAFRVGTIARRLGSDPWGDWKTLRQRL